MALNTFAGQCCSSTSGIHQISSNGKDTQQGLTVFLSPWLRNTHSSINQLDCFSVSSTENYTVDSVSEQKRK